jgi:N-methylhydantoinase A
VPADRINGCLEALKKRALQLMKSEGIKASRQRFEFSLDVRHKGQINEVEVLLPSDRLAVGYEATLRKLFLERYEKLYGRGSALHGAQLEIVVCRLRARALTPRPKLLVSKRVSRAIPRAAKRKARPIYWSELGKSRTTPVFDGEQLASGNQLKGPAIVETADTTVVVHPGRTLRVDALGNFEITFK